MRRVLTVAVLLSAAAAFAQTSRPMPQPQPAPPILRPTGQAYAYTARTAAPVRRAGAVTAGNITWTCAQSSCTVAGPWATPAVGACQALAREVGAIVAYGHPNAQLTAAQLTQCNAGSASPQPTLTPPARPGTPPILRPTGQTYAYTARTDAPVRRAGAVTAGNITWTCAQSSCTVTGPWATPAVGACQALAREVGAIVAYGHPNAQLTAAQLTQCNVGSASAEAPPSPPPTSTSLTGGTAIRTPEMFAVGGSARALAADRGPIVITTPEMTGIGGSATARAPDRPPVAITTPPLTATGE